jgi:hypothetical protein
MKRIILLIIIFLSANMLYADDSTFEVKTGFGYVKDSNGNIIAKYDLPKGNHPTQSGYYYFEVATKNDLNNIKVYIEPEVETPAQERSRLINEKMREMAESELIAEGKITAKK